MTTVYIDESGYTGPDLLNVSQRFFALVAHIISEEESTQLKAEYFGGNQARELKFSQLWRRPRSQRQIIQFLAEIPHPEESIKVSITHKRFALTAKMFDMLVETVAHEDGFDAYERGFNIAFSNMAYNAIPVLAGIEFFEDLLKAFQRLMRYRTREAYDHYFELIDSIEGPAELVEVLEWFKLFDLRLGFEYLPDRELLDVTLSSALVLMNSWRFTHPEPIRVVADASSRLLSERPFLDALNNPELAKQTVGHDRRTLSLPLVFDEIALERSESYNGLQLADLIAGAMTRACANANQNTSSLSPNDEELRDIVLKFECFGIAPSTAITPEELDTAGPIHAPAADALAQIMRNLPDNPKKTGRTHSFE